MWPLHRFPRCNHHFSVSHSSRIWEKMFRSCSCSCSLFVELISAPVGKRDGISCRQTLRSNMTGATTEESLKPKILTSVLILKVCVVIILQELVLTCLISLKQRHTHNTHSLLSLPLRNRQETQAIWKGTGHLFHHSSPKMTKIVQLIFCGNPECNM